VFESLRRHVSASIILHSYRLSVIFNPIGLTENVSPMGPGTVVMRQPHGSWHCGSASTPWVLALW